MGHLGAYFLRLDLRSFVLVAGKNIEIEVELAMSRYMNHMEEKLLMFGIESTQTSPSI